MSEEELNPFPSRKLSIVDAEAITQTIGRMIAVAQVLSGKSALSTLHGTETDEELETQLKETFGIVQEVFDGHVFDQTDAMAQMFRKALERCQEIMSLKDN